VLFLRFAAIYGYMWSSSYKSGSQLELAKKEWADALKNYESGVIKEALLICRNKNNFPPSLPQFSEYCKALERRHDDYFVKDVERRPSRPEVVEENLKKIYKILKSR
jgi:hypothetical protein